MPHEAPEYLASIEEDGPVDEMRAAETPEPNTNDEPMPART